MRGQLVRDRYVLLRGDGLVRQVDDEWTFVAWDEVAEVRFDEEAGVALLELRSGEHMPLEDRLAGVDGKGFAARAREVHRRAIWGIYS